MDNIKNIKIKAQYHVHDFDNVFAKLLIEECISVVRNSEDCNPYSKQVIEHNIRKYFNLFTQQ